MVLVLAAFLIEVMLDLVPSDSVATFDGDIATMHQSPVDALYVGVAWGSMESHMHAS